MPSAPLRVCLTFDLDVVEHDRELSERVPPLASLLAERGLRATWFLRLDDQVAALRGRPDDLLAAHAARLDELRASRHELGWHPHSFRRGPTGWEQNTDPGAVAAELARHAPLAQEHGLRVVRAGWGFHCNESLAALERAGFALDSSAIPRPRYPWEESVKDWEGTPPEPYRPSRADYRRPGQPALDLLEVPISVTELAAPYDTEPGVRRYLDLTYRSELLEPALAAWIERHPLLVSISHPQTLDPAAPAHALLCHELANVAENLDHLERLGRSLRGGIEFVTLSEVRERGRP